ncbi:mortality factor 4-like protein 2 [Nannospalax galili]|uniref:mortality factor 4-like protein 2 n=1 Tax=Nannospalax galili TaxID=1026970 RepID=UPI0004ED6926|nr:mortality factor 4-like protein 2 [Nannospalax galili]
MPGASLGNKSTGRALERLQPALPKSPRGRPPKKASPGAVQKIRNNTEKTRGRTSKVPPCPRKKKAPADTTVEKNGKEVEVKIPDKLKSWLVMDWDLVTKEKQLFKLPAKKNVDAILGEYATCKKLQGNADDKENAVDELVAAIREYFNVMLGRQLLCKFEKVQYAEILLTQPDVPMSQVYGAPHLLRLFVTSGGKLAHSSLDRQSLESVSGHLHDFLDYLAENSASLFRASDYKVAPAEYIRKAL